MILCSECYDAADVTGYSGMVCQATCEKCGRKCLGYVAEEEQKEVSK